jgi:hypothetical protein
MQTDLYTKSVLTVIALALLWIGIGGPQLLTVHAQDGQRVYIAGWSAYEGRGEVEKRIGADPLPVQTR